MTKTNTRSRIVSILLALVMLLTMVPITGVTALAADTYPKANEVSVDGGKYFAEPRCYYFKNGATACSKDPKGSNATYDPITGTLTLDGYNGGSIEVGGTKSKITVVLVGKNSINNGSLTSAWGGDITVTSDSSGTLSISKTTSGSNPAIGIETGYGSIPTGNVTIKGNAKVTINMTHNGTKTYDKAYGIFAKENITISENASVDITCATPNNTTGGDYCNGLRAEKNVIIETNGTIKIDVTKAGKDDGYSFGVYPMGNAILTKVGEMEVQWKKHATHSSYPGGAVYKGASLSDTDYAINEDTTNCYASYRYGTPYTVRVKNGDFTGPGVKYAKGSGNFLVGDKVNITPYEKKSNDEMLIPFQKWTSSDVTFDKSATTASNSFTVPGKNVTVTAMHSPFVGAPVFKRTDDSKGTIAFQTAVKPDGSVEYFQYVEVGKENDPYGYRSIAPQPITASTASPYEYSVSASNYYTGGDIKNLEAGDYRMAVTLNGERYLSDPFTVNYTAPVTTYTVSFNANGGSGTMADVTGISGEYTLPANGFTAPAGKQFKAWSVGGVEKAVGDKITVTANTTVTAVWEAVEYNVTVTGGTASVGAGTEITKAAEGTTVTLTANAAPTDMVFDKWEVISGSITLADANSATTTFTMPAGAVSVKATYTTYITVNLAAGEGSGTMEPIIIKNTYGYFSLTAPECTFTAPANKVFDKWQFSKDDSYLKPGDTKTIWSSADGATLTAIWKDAPVTEYDITVTDGKATVGAGTEITKAAEGTTVTLTAGAAPTGKVFDKWEVVSGGITLADVNSATTTFTMPASAVSVKATYKNAPHTHTYNQETVKPEALKTPADCTHNAVYFKSCSCGAISTTDAFVAMNTALGHAYGSDWKYDSTNHWHECSRCHDKKDEAAHSASEWIIDTAATETAKGAKHKECTVCKKVLETATIPATGSTHTHSYGVYVTPATTSKDGKIVKKCSACKNVASKKTIYKASKISISNKTYTYDGKAKKPTVTVKDSKGKKLSKGKDYTVSYSSGRKNVGRYAVKIKLKGNYSGTVTKTFDIVPKGTSIKKISASKKGFKVYWKAQKKNTTGYEIQYSTAKSFKNAKTVKVSKNSATSQSVAKLSGKKKYFVRVRTYKTVKYNGKKCKVYSSWSKPKTVVTKK